MINSNQITQLLIVALLVFAIIIFIIAPFLVLLIMLLLNFAFSLNITLTYWQLVAAGAALQLVGVLLAPTLRPYTKIN
jgi:hypothetical protein